MGLNPRESKDENSSTLQTMYLPPGLADSKTLFKSSVFVEYLPIFNFDLFQRSGLSAIICSLAKCYNG